MTKKTWCIYLLCLGIAIALFVTPPKYLTNPQSPSATTELRGVWLTNFGGAVLFFPQGVNRVLYQLRQLNFNTVYPVVWNRGNTFYPSTVAKREIGNTQNPFQAILMLVHLVLAQIVRAEESEKVCALYPGLSMALWLLLIPN